VIDARMTGSLADEVRRIPWYHTIDLGGGVVTPGRDDTPRRVARLRLPEGLSGTTVLDVGAWDGYFSFEAERRGAARVLATDSFVWRGEGWGSREGFELARRALGSRVEDMEIDVLELSAQRPGRFDLVLFLGVLYHMRHPLLALERIADVTANQLILETHVDMLGSRRPAAAFYPGSETWGDPTTWWGLNPKALEAMLRLIGFRRVECVSRRSRLRAAFDQRARRVAHEVVDRMAGRTRPAGPEALRQAWVVYHAHK
jgi:tRNA (mo5U34)-methyltransferase